MRENQLAVLLIDNYNNLQRIKTGQDREKEIDYQIRAAKSTLQALGIITEPLDLK